MAKLEKKIANCKKGKKSEETQSYMPYYDSIIEKKARS
jgi:hypothetical protein